MDNDYDCRDINVTNKEVMIFKSNGLSTDDDLECTRNKIKQQMDTGIIALNNTVDFVGYLKATDNGFFIFKDNGLLMKDDIEYLRKKIREQIEDGVVVLNGNVEFVGYIGRNN